MISKDIKDMETLTENNSGFTIIEVLISLAVMLVFLPFAANMLINSQMLASYSKHKIEAAYAAQQMIETQRQQPFVSVPIGGTIYIPSPPLQWEWAILDTKGSYTNLDCNINTNIVCGKALFTVTQATYVNSAGKQAASPNVDHYVLTITWNEQIIGSQKSFTETYAEDIANDSMLN